MRVLPLTLSLVLFCAVVAGDTLYLTNGGKFEGKLVEKTASHYVFDVQGMGVQRFPVHKVLRVEEGESALDEYERRSAALEPEDAEAHFQLGLWCEEQKLSREARKHFDRTLQLDPDHAELRKKLGYVEYDGRWLKAEEARKLRAARSAARSEEVDAFFKSYGLLKSRRLAGERIWYWPPEFWKVEEFPGRPKVLLWGPVMSGIGYQIGLEVLETTAPVFQEELEVRLIRERGYRVDEKAHLQEIEPAEGLKLGYRGGSEDRPIRSYHALLGYGSRMLHAHVVGPGDSPVFMRMIFSDLLSSLAFEPPPDLGDKLFDFRLPGPEWGDAREIIKIWARQLTSATEERKKELNYRIYALTRTLQVNSKGSRHICLRDGLTAISVRVRWRLGMSRLSLQEAVDYYMRGDSKKDPGPVTERRVAGRKALFLSYTLEGSRCWFCTFIKGDKLYDVIAWNLEPGGRGDRMLKTGFDAVLGSFRLP